MTTDTALAKISLDEQIEWAEVLIKCDSGIAPAVLASLKELAAIKSQPVPVEPEQIKMMRYDEPEGRNNYERAITDYIDSLQSALQVAQQERDAERERGDQWETAATNLLARAEKAEAELAALRLELGQITGEIPYGN